MNSLLLSQNDSFSELSKLADLGEKNVQKENRERKKKFACTEALSEKQGDRWESRGRLRGEEGEDENYGSREDFYLLGIVLCMCGFLVRYIWFAATKLSCAIQKQIKTEFSDINLTKVCFFLSWEKMLSLWFVFVLCN